MSRARPHVRGMSTLSLAAALVCAAAAVGAGAGTSGPDPDRDGDGSAITEMLAFVDDHLADPNLSAATIAEHRGTSTGEIERQAAAHDIDLGRWIVAQRLRGVRAELGPEHSPEPDDALARRWGFVDLRHLDSTFAETYGLGVEHWWRIRDER